MAKYVPITEETEYIALDAKIKILGKKQADCKTRFAAYYKKGMKFRSIDVIEPHETSSIKWREVAEQFIAKLPAKERKVFNRQLAKDYPPSDVGVSFKLTAARKKKKAEA